MFEFHFERSKKAASLPPYHFSSEILFPLSFLSLWDVHSRFLTMMGLIVSFAEDIMGFHRSVETLTLDVVGMKISKLKIRYSEIALIMMYEYIYKCYENVYGIIRMSLCNEMNIKVIR